MSLGQATENVVFFPQKNLPELGRMHGPEFLCKCGETSPVPYKDNKTQKKDQPGDSANVTGLWDGE